MKLTIRRALLSCTDKTGIKEFAAFLSENGASILSTGGTAAYLREAGVAVRDVSDFTGFPEMLDGRIKTLHPRVHGGVLARRDDPEHALQMASHGLEPIDLVAVNLYPFEKTVADPARSFAEAIENIDIGGPALLRSAAKNHGDVVVVCDPADYAGVMEELRKSNDVSRETRIELAAKAFARTAAYDAAITHYLSEKAGAGSSAGTPTPPPRIEIRLALRRELRYGENPHQKAAFYVREGSAPTGIGGAEILQGKEPSYNNILDAEAALACCRDLDAPGFSSCVIVKHNNPCGAARAERPSEAFLRARACDPVASFGGIVAVSRPVDAASARVMTESFFEVVIAPDFDAEARTIFSAKKNLRLLRLGDCGALATDRWDLRCAGGGVLVQELDLSREDVRGSKVVTRRKPTEEEWEALDFSWRIVRHVRSNAIVYASADRTLGIGAGQMSRVDAVKLGAMKAAETFGDFALKGASAASDAFFPFRDGMDILASHGVTAVIQPGGSVRDAEVIAAADAHGIAMVFTGVRHFRH